MLKLIFLDEKKSEVRLVDYMENMFTSIKNVFCLLFFRYKKKLVC